MKYNIALTAAVSTLTAQVSAENKYWKLLEQAEYERYVNVPAPVHKVGEH